MFFTIKLHKSGKNLKITTTFIYLSKFLLDDEMTLKRLKNIRKIQARKKKNDADDDNDADSDDESEFRIKSKPKTIDEILAMTDAGLEDNDEDEENDSKKKVHIICKK